MTVKVYKIYSYKNLYLDQNESALSRMLMYFVSFARASKVN